MAGPACGCGGARIRRRASARAATMVAARFRRCMRTLPGCPQPAGGSVRAPMAIEAGSLCGVVLPLLGLPARAAHGGCRAAGHSGHSVHVWGVTVLPPVCLLRLTLSDAAARSAGALQKIFLPCPPSAAAAPAVVHRSPQPRCRSASSAYSIPGRPDSTWERTERFRGYLQRRRPHVIFLLAPCMRMRGVHPGAASHCAELKSCAFSREPCSRSQAHRHSDESDLAAPGQEAGAEWGGQGRAAGMHFSARPCQLGRGVLGSAWQQLRIRLHASRARTWLRAARKVTARTRPGRPDAPRGRARAGTARSTRRCARSWACAWRSRCTTRPRCRPPSCAPSSARPP